MKNKTLRTAADLVAMGAIAPGAAAAITNVAAKYAIAISPQLLDIIDNPGIHQQFVPQTVELENKAEELIDPIGDVTYSPVKGIIHRYPDRCLLQPVKVCPVYCRFCFRRETVGPGNAALTPTELQACYTYLAQHPEIWEVILSGGDPLILKPKQLQAIITAIAQFPHIEIIRIHTRVPMVVSDKITPEMLHVLRSYRPIYMVLHINHPAEFSPQAIKAIEQLVDNGVVLLGQSVLLKGINDNIETLSNLMRSMVKHRIKPYYLHHGDLAAGTSHFRTSIAAGQELITALRGNYSGLCQPQFMLDIPGGAGKSPIGPSYCKKADYSYEIKDYKGKVHTYVDSTES